MTSDSATEPSSDMKIKVDPARAKVLCENLAGIKTRVESAKAARKIGTGEVRLIAVSKLKPINDILALHSAPHQHLDFGENYLQELQQKASIYASLRSSSSLPPNSPTTPIRWHFIGALQTNKCRPLARDVPNLFCVSSVDSAKKADELEKGRREAEEASADAEGQKTEAKADGTGGKAAKLNIHIQVNTSGEDSKSGVSPTSTPALCAHIRDHCPHLHLLGLMTIGAIARSQASTPETVNEDFVKLAEVRREVAKELKMEEGELELSMGMSADFEAAIGQGSGEVRVGSEIFGERPQKGDAKVKEDVEEGAA